MMGLIVALVSLAQPISQCAHRRPRLWVWVRLQLMMMCHLQVALLHLAHRLHRRQSHWFHALPGKQGQKDVFGCLLLSQGTSTTIFLATEDLSEPITIALTWMPTAPTLVTAIQEIHAG
jgi:hypothetical protein